MGEEMIVKRNKTRKLRGHVSRGHGGGFSHHKTLFTKYHPDYLGKRGMKIFHRKTQDIKFNAINTSKLLTFIKHEEVPAGKAPVIDLRAYGIHKVLGRGELSLQQPVVVIAKQFTEEARKKIESVGGCVIVSA